jgi:hypothetical protein
LKIFINLFLELINIKSKFSSKLSNSQRSARGTLSSKVRSVLFQTFGEDKLPMIKTTASPSEIMVWKADERVAECYENLFKPMNSKKKKLFLTRIVEEALSPKVDPPNVQAAFAIAICTSILNPKNTRLQLNEKIMKRRVEYFLVSFRNFVNCDVLHYSNDLLTNFYFLKDKLCKNEPIGPDDDEDEYEDGEEKNDDDD